MGFSQVTAHTHTHTPVVNSYLTPTAVIDPSSHVLRDNLPRQQGSKACGVSSDRPQGADPEIPVTENTKHVDNLESSGWHEG